MTEDKEKLFDDVGVELGELRRTADRLDEAVATQFGLNRTDLRCIGILYRRGRVTAGELAEESGLTPGAITTVLDRMERDGYANRVADPSDRRRVMVTSTTATRELGARVYGEVELAGRAQLEQIEPAGEFEGGVPDIAVDGGTVSIGHKRRFLPFDWRNAKSEIWLNPAVPWEISLKGGMWKLAADFRGLELRLLDVGGGASDVEIWLPAPVGPVAVRVSGGASHVRLHRPVASALRADVTGGASQLIFDGQRLGSIGGRNRLETPGFAAAADRYEVRLSGGASQLDIDVV